jgi:hypothetical protein
MEMGLSWLFLVTNFKGNLWRTRDIEWFSGYSEKRSVIDTGKDLLCLEVSRVRRIWWSLEEAWCSLRGPETLLCSLLIFLQ